MKYFFCFSVLVCSIALVCCSSSSEPSFKFQNLLPASIGDYWVYECFDLDENNYIKTESIQMDSVFYVGTEEFLNKTALKFSVINSINTEPYPLYLNYNNSLGKLYAHCEFIFPSKNEFTFPKMLMSSEWLNIIDNKKNKWGKNTVNTIGSIPYNIGNKEIDVTPYYDYIGKRERKTVFTIDGINYDATEFIIESVIHGHASTYTNKFVYTDFKCSIFTHLWFVDNLGLVKKIVKSSQLVINLEGMDPIINYYPGYQAELIKYNVADKVL